MRNLISKKHFFMKNIVLVLTVFLGGCHNYYKDYYQQSPSYKAENIISYTGEPKILHSSNSEGDVATLFWTD